MKHATLQCSQHDHWTPVQRVSFQAAMEKTYSDHGLWLFTKLHLCCCQVNETALYRVLLIVVHVYIGPPHNLWHTGDPSQLCKCQLNKTSICTGKWLSDLLHICEMCHSIFFNNLVLGVEFVAVIKILSTWDISCSNCSVWLVFSVFYIFTVRVSCILVRHRYKPQLYVNSFVGASGHIILLCRPYYFRTVTRQSPGMDKSFQ